MACDDGAGDGDVTRVQSPATSGSTRTADAPPEANGDTMARKRLGASGERLAGTWLEARGYRIVARNWRCPYGELDLVTERAGELVFVEVKTRRGQAMGLPEEALTPRKQQHLILAAQSYLEAAGAPERPYRIDVVAIQLSPTGRLLQVRHYERAVEA